MIRFELQRILRNPKGTYSILILLSMLMCAYMVSESTTYEVMYNLHMEKRELIQCIGLLSTLVLNVLLYTIAGEEEHQNTWKTLLSYPVAQGRRIVSKLLVLFVFQLPMFCIPIGMYFIFYHEFHIQLLSFTWCIQILYLTSFLYSTFVVSSGYVNAEGIRIVNVLKISTPIFLFFCLSDIESWMFAFHVLGSYITMCCVILLIVLLLWNQALIHRKLYREIIVFTLFGQLSLQTSEMWSTNARSIGDKILQKAFQLYPKKNASYWRICASIEVGIKQSGCYSLCCILCVILWSKTSYYLFLVVAILCLIGIAYNSIKERKKIHSVYI